ncbi:MAG: hypothetical protein K9K67_04490 [Bacteriovoracaceae bacterium]|nr:hypothetical protein [Bacteriovoracaceae bacterium]
MRLTKSFLILFFLSLFVFSSNTKAGVLIEPYLGFSLAGSGDTTFGTNKYEHSYSSPTIGGRLGYGMLGFMGGIDYSMQTFDLESERGSTTNKDGVKKSQLGIFVGYNLPILLRVWGTYFLSSSLEGDDPQTASNLIDSRYEYSSGSGYALGAGFTGLPFVSVNLEYRTLEYDKLEVSGTALSTYNEKTDLSEIMLSVSLPLDL